MFTQNLFFNNGGFGPTTTFATGGTYCSIPGWNVHIFCSSGTFYVPYGGTDFEYLIIGGGGGGGTQLNSINNAGGGGGGGGWRCCTGVTLSSGTYQVVVGQGGASLSNGGISCFNNVVSAGGGAGGLGNVVGQCGCDGGNGGGGAGSNGSVSNGGAGNTPNVSPSQGFPGGSGLSNTCGSSYMAGGGGGAGGTGAPAVFTYAGYGGIGKASCITGATAWYSGGGGGGGGLDTIYVGGVQLGGGGTGGLGSGLAGKGNAGHPNTGGGGGGSTNSTSGQPNPGGVGGSGIVIIRYPSIDPDSQAYINAVLASGGYLTSLEQSAINKFYLGLKSNSLYPLIDEMWLIFGGTQTSSGLRGINPSGTGFTWYGNWTFSNSAGAVKSRSTYGTTSADMNFNNSNLILGNRHYSVYCSRNANNPAGYDLAVEENGIICSYGNNSFYALANGTSYPAVYTSNTDTRGFYITNEISNGTVNGWKNGSKVISNTSITSQIYTGNLTLGGKSIPNGETTDRDYIFCSVGKSLTDSQAQIYSTLVNNLQTAFTRNTY